VEPPAFEILEEEPGQRVRVTFQVPAEAPFFAEHFPRKPVYPATMLLDGKIRVAQRLLGAEGGRWRLRRVTHVKISAFTSPGERLEVEAVRLAGSADEATVQLTGVRAAGRMSRARMEFVSLAG
jgi:3-hydroxymyristoyl/3-hydroxydecanoyl-(acyl carrier protein) dehydratase